ncbi:MAG TPA: hypothetical protein VFT31_11410 [Kribbella sp.]|nr:hypothetical protein [Kribbella sp.]
MNVVLLATRRLPAAYFETLRADLGGDPELGLDVIAWSPPREPVDEVVRRFLLIGPGRMPVAAPPTTPASPTPPASKSTPVTPKSPAQPTAKVPTGDPPRPAGLGRRVARRLVAAARWRYRRLRRDGVMPTLKRLPATLKKSRPARWLRARRAKEVSRTYWTRITSRPDVLALIDKADVVVALDAAAVWAGWNIGRRTADTPVVLGVPAARRELDRLRVG